MKVVHFQRKSLPGYFSVERIFEDVRAWLAGNGVAIELQVNRHASKGLAGRLIDMIAAMAAQGDVNHVTGDVHYLTILLRRKRTVLTVLDCVNLHRLTGIRRFLFWLFWYWLPVRRCAIVTVISEAGKQELLRQVHVDPARIEVIHPAVSAEFVHVAASFDAQRPRILQVGSTSNKNLERVAHALEGLTCKWIIVGELDPARRALFQSLGIDFLERSGLSRDELRGEYERADLVVFASTYEGFGMPIIEANAVGRPVITSNSCSMPEVAGDAAILVDPASVVEIRAAIDRIVSSPELRASLVANGLRNARRFRVEAIAPRYAELYRRIDARRQGGAGEALKQDLPG